MGPGRATRGIPEIGKGFFGLTKLIDQEQNQGNDDAEDDTTGQWKVKRGIAFPEREIPGKFAQEGNAIEEVNHEAYAQENNSSDD